MIPVKPALALLLSLATVTASPITLDFSRYKAGNEIEDGDEIKGTNGALEYRGGVPDWVKDETLFGKAEIVEEGKDKMLLFEALGKEGVYPWTILRLADTFQLAGLRQDLKIVVEFKILELGPGNGAGMGLFLEDTEEANTGAYDVLKSGYSALALRWGSESGFSLQRSVNGTEQSYWGGEWHDEGGGIFLKIDKGLNCNLRATFKVNASAKSLAFSLFDMDTDTDLINNVSFPISELNDALKSSTIRFALGKLMNNSVPSMKMQISKFEVSGL